MIVDASALLAVALGEEDWDVFADALLDAGGSRISAINWLEAAIQVDKRDDPVVSERFDDLTREAGIEIAPVTLEQAQAARQAWRSFGRGRHPARLNLADCFAYALAKTEGEGLLFKGDDFAQTDIAPAIKGR